MTDIPWCRGNYTEVRPFFSVFDILYYDKIQNTYTEAALHDNIIIISCCGKIQYNTKWTSAVITVGTSVYDNITPIDNWTIFTAFLHILRARVSLFPSRVVPVRRLQFYSRARALVRVAIAPATGKDDSSAGSEWGRKKTAYKLLDCDGGKGRAR